VERDGQYANSDVWGLPSVSSPGNQNPPEAATEDEYFFIDF
jgi:hypothetical protein